MPTEIERKFLVRGNGWRRGPGVRYSQGYLNRDRERTVRVRLAGKKAFLTIKGLSVGASRLEFEYPIPFAHARQLLKLCDGPVVEKIRRKVRHEGFTWEVDEFLGENAGLVVAELELTSENQKFEKPAWCGKEVTHDTRYLNSNLATRPFRIWRHSTSRSSRP